MAIAEQLTGTGQAFLGAVAQVESYRDAIAEVRETPAKGVLLFAGGDAPEELEAIANSAEVELVKSSSSRPAAIGKSLSALSSSADRAPSVKPQLDASGA